MTVSSENQDAGAPAQYVTFCAGDLLLGVPIEQVEEINRMADPTPVPHAPECVRGVINLRGEVVTVVDLRTVLGFDPLEAGRETRNVILNFNGEHVGLIVDRMADVVSAASGEIDRPPANIEGRFYCGVYKLESELMVLLDVENVLTAGSALC
jgi:purine-binding chemotaxis protein CheW